MVVRVSAVFAMKDTLCSLTYWTQECEHDIPNSAHDHGMGLNTTHVDRLQVAQQHSQSILHLLQGNSARQSADDSARLYPTTQQQNSNAVLAVYDKATLIIITLQYQNVMMIRTTDVENFVSEKDSPKFKKWDSVQTMIMILTID